MIFIHEVCKKKEIVHKNFFNKEVPPFEECTKLNEYLSHIGGNNFYIISIQDFNFFVIYELTILTMSEINNDLLPKQKYSNSTNKPRQIYTLSKELKSFYVDGNTEKEMMYDTLKKTNSFYDNLYKEKLLATGSIKLDREDSLFYNKGVFEGTIYYYNE